MTEYKSQPFTKERVALTEKLRDMGIDMDAALYIVTIAKKPQVAQNLLKWIEGTSTEPKWTQIADKAKELREAEK